MKRLILLLLLLSSAAAWGQTTAISNLTATWNNAGTTFNGIKMNITDTASAAGSSALWLGFAGTESFRVDKDGTVHAATALSVGGATPFANHQISIDVSGLAILNVESQDNDAEISIDSGGANRDSYLYFRDDSSARFSLRYDSADNQLHIRQSGNVAMMTFDNAVSETIVNDSGNDIDFRVEGSGAANALFVRGSDGRVAVNNVTPSALFDVRGAVGAAGIMELSTAETTVVANDQLGRINFRAPDEASGGDAITVSNSIYAEATAEFNSSFNGSDLVFATAGGGLPVARMRLTNAGRLGIQTSAPNALLDVRGIVGAAGIIELSTAETTVEIGDQLGRISFRAPDEASGTDAILPGAAIYAEALAEFTSSINTTDIVFATATGGIASEKMRLASDGLLSVYAVLSHDFISLSNNTEGNVARLTRHASHEVHTLANAATSDTTTISIPTNSKLLAVSFTVNTAIVDDGGNDSWSAAFVTGSTQTLATAAAAAQNTKVDTWHPIYEISSGISEIRFTANGGSFTAGVIEIVAYFESLTSLAN